MRSPTLVLIVVFSIISTQVAFGDQRWQNLPPTPTPVEAAQTGYASVNGISLYYAIVGAGSPVVFLHSGLANSDWWGNQVKALMSRHKVVLLDSRGHGRSSRNAKAFSYDLMADDVIALLDKLKISKADVVGWSDGAILGLDMAIRYPNRVGKIFAFGANTSAAGLIAGAEKTPAFAAYFDRIAQEYTKLSPTPGELAAFIEQISQMWESEPNWTDAQLKSIKSPVWVVVGDHEEAISRSHSDYIAATIPGAGLLILPNVGHFAPLQDPGMFNAAVLQFLDKE